MFRIVEAGDTAAVKALLWPERDRDGETEQRVSQIVADVRTNGEAALLRYAREFDHKWLRGGAAPDEPLIGSADIQSLADLGNSFEVVKGMRLAPFTLQTVLQLAVTTLVPVVPLALTMISLEELLLRLLKIVF